MRTILKFQIYVLIIFGFGLIFAISCKKSDDTSTVVSIGNTTWDATIGPSTASWHADIKFNADGTTTYDEPSSPGTYLSHGTYTLSGNKIHFNIGLDPYYIFDGTISGNNMSGTYSYNTEARPWSATKRL